MAGLGDYFVREKKAEKVSAAEKSFPEETGKESADIIDALLHNKEILTKIDTPYGDFEFKYPSGGDQLRIAHRRAAYLGGHPDASFDNLRRMQFEQWATLDILVVGKPERFKDMESWADCPDPELADQIYERGARFCGDIREKIRGARPGKPASGGKPANP